MGVAIVDAETLIAFVESPGGLQDSVDTFFDSGGSLDIRDRIRKILPVETKSQEDAETLLAFIFERFGTAGDGSIGREEFKALMAEMVLALARGIGDLPVIMALHPDSWLSMAVQQQQQNQLLEAEINLKGKSNVNS